MQRRTAFVLGGALVTLWTLVVAAVFALTDMTRWRTLSTEELAIFNGEAMLQLPAALGTPGQVSVIHFYDATCPCSRFTRTHLQDLGASLKTTRQYVFAADVDGLSAAPLAAGIDVVPADLAHQWQRLIPASPAIGIWDGNGRLAYFGPYSNGPVCGTGTSFVETTLKVLSRGENPAFINTDATGCFCSWHPVTNDLAGRFHVAPQ